MIKLFYFIIVFQTLTGKSALMNNFDPEAASEELEWFDDGFDSCG